MPKLNEYDKKQQEKLVEKARELRARGLTLQQVGIAVRKTHQWVSFNLKKEKKLSTD